MTNKITLNSIKKVQSASDFLKLLTSTDDLSTLELPIDINTLIQRIESVEYSDDPSFENWNKSGFTKVERDANLRVNKITIIKWYAQLVGLHGLFGRKSSYC